MRVSGGFWRNGQPRSNWRARFHPFFTIRGDCWYMTNYRRRRIPGGTYFFTVNLAERGSTLLVDHIHDLRCAYLDTWKDRPFRCDAFVVLPDQLHAIWTLPVGDSDFSNRWGAIKSRFTRRVKGKMGATPILRSPSKIKKGDAGIWQRRFWEHAIRDSRDYDIHLHYCWNSPVKHGHAARAIDWPYSSIHRDIRAGLITPEGSEPMAARLAGE